MLGWVNLNVDNLLVGRFSGSTALGIYSIAYNVMALPSQNLMSPLRDVLYAAFARLHDEPRRLGNAWLRINNLAGSVLVPAFLGLAAVGGARLRQRCPWPALGRRHTRAPAAQHRRRRSEPEGVQRPGLPGASGRPGLFLRFLCFSTAVMVSAFGVGLIWGVVGVAGSYAVARTIVLVANSIQMSRLMDFDLPRILRSYVEIYGRAAAMGATVYVGHRGLVDLGVPVGARLAVLPGHRRRRPLPRPHVCLAPEVLRDARDGVRRRRAATV